MVEEARLSVGNISVFSNEDNIFVLEGDHFFLEISGDDKAIVTEIIRLFKDYNSASEVHGLLSGPFEIDEDYFQAIIAWLQENKILVPERENKDSSTRPSVVVFSGSGSEKICSELKKTIGEFQISASLEEIGPNTIVVFFSPLFENYEQFLEAADGVYQKDIIGIHVGISDSYFTIGPASRRSVGTPCLRCYAQRKITNLRHPGNYLRFIQYNNRERIKNFDITATANFRLAVLHLESVVKRLSMNPSYDALFGQAVTFDNFQYQTTRSRILKTPNCPVCNSILAQTVFDNE